MNLSDLDETARIALGKRIQQECRRLRWTQRDLAEQARYDEKTIRNVMNGLKVRPGCIEDICEALHLTPADITIASGISEEHGGYTARHVEQYIGFFFAYRRSFTFPTNILRSVYEFKWNAQRSCLNFSELQKYVSKELDASIDYSQSGEVFISPTVGLLHLLTRCDGAVRLITMTKIRSDDMTMRGIVLTQAQGEFFYQPSASAVLMKKCDPAFTTETLAEQVGPIRSGDQEYEQVNQALADAERKVSVFALTGGLR